MSSVVSASRTESRIDALEWTKGLAILGVLCIHGQALVSTWLYAQLINRAVPIFLVLFGITSELWWQRAERRTPDDLSKRWLTKRLSRFLPGYYAVMSLWWMSALLLRETHPIPELRPWHLLVTFAGFSPWAATTWFVSVILVITLALPLLRRGFDLFGTSLWLLLTAALCGTCGWYILLIEERGNHYFGPAIHGPPFYYYWVFVPRYVWHVMAGVFIARTTSGRLSRRQALLAIVASAAGLAVWYAVGGPPGDLHGVMRQNVVANLIDAPIAVALLGSLTWLPLPSFIASPLSWLGRWSWGIYLGHICVYEVAYVAGFPVGRIASLQGAVVVLGLLASGWALAALGDKLRRRAAVLRPG